MRSNELLLEAFGRVRQLMGTISDGLPTLAMHFRVDAEANTIAWLLWHLTRVQDDHVADLAGVEQAWTADGWHRRFDLPFDSAELGYGHNSEQVGRVRIKNPALLADYHDAVHALTTTYLEGVDAQELDRVIDTSWDPPVTVGVRLVSVLQDTLEHLGQAAYVRGVVERLG